MIRQLGFVGPVPQSIKKPDQRNQWRTSDWYWLLAIWGSVTGALMILLLKAAVLQPSVSQDETAAPIAPVAALAAVPRVRTMLSGQALDPLLRSSDVLSGRWQPRAAEGVTRVAVATEEVTARPAPVASAKPMAVPKRTKPESNTSAVQRPFGAPERPAEGAAAVLDPRVPATDAGLAGSSAALRTAEVPARGESGERAVSVSTVRGGTAMLSKPAATPVSVSEPSVPHGGSVKQAANAPLDGTAAVKLQARAYLAQQRADSAYRLLRPGVSEARHDVEYLALLGVAALGSARYDAASVIYERLAAFAPENERWAAGLAISQAWSAMARGERAGSDSNQTDAAKALAQLARGTLAGR